MVEIDNSNVINELVNIHYAATWGCFFLFCIWITLLGICSKK